MPMLSLHIFPFRNCRTPVAVHSLDQIADRPYGVLRLVGALDFLRALRISSDIRPFQSIAITHPRHDSGDIRLRVPLSPKRRQRQDVSSPTRDQSQRDDMCPDPRRPISRPTPTVKIQSGDKSPHSEIRTPVTGRSSDEIADRHYGVLRLVGALDFLRALRISSDIHPFRSIATTHPRHDSGDIRLRVPLSPKRRQRQDVSSPTRDSPNGTTCALTRNVLTRDAQSRGPPHR
jgi:hypothetical protein